MNQEQFNLVEDLVQEHEFSPQVLQEECIVALRWEIRRQCSTTTESRPLATKLMRFCHIQDEQFVALANEVAREEQDEDPMESWSIRQGCSRKSLVGWPPTYEQSRVAFLWAVENGRGANAMDIAKAYHIVSPEEKAQAAERWVVDLLIPIDNCGQHVTLGCRGHNKDRKAQAFQLIEEYHLDVGRIVRMLPLVRAVRDVGFAYRLMDLAKPIDVVQSH